MSERPQRPSAGSAPKASSSLVRGAALAGRLRIGDPHTLDAIIEATDPAQPLMLRLAAVGLAAALPDDAATTVLASSLSDPWPFIALQALALAQARPACAPIQRVTDLTGPNVTPAVRRAALRVLRAREPLAAR